MRGPDGHSLEDFDMIENLMLHGGVTRRGGPVVVHPADPDTLWTDLTAFEECLKALACRRESSLFHRRSRQSRHWTVQVRRRGG